jgi:general secretion pathway protein E
VLHLVHQIPTPVLNAAISRLKAIGRLDIIEKRRPQDGRIKTRTPEHKEVELRLSTMPTTFGEKLVMRIFDPEVLVRSLADLGLSPKEETQWQNMVEQPYGMVVVTGPTGSGKTTTLYSALKRLAKPEVNICTIEDPIELVDPDLNQMYVQHQIGLDFATGVRTLLRQDPDIIMVGEIRDEETANTAVQAALTGHLVLSTVHTNDAPSTVTRFLELGVPPYLLKVALIGVVAQRLVRTLCHHCKEPAEITQDQWRSLVAPMRLRRPARVCAPVGCDECRNTGYLGRIGIYEVMRLNDDLRRIITAETESRRMRDAALAGGMLPLRISGAQKVAAGLTTAAEVFAAVQDEDAG